MFSKSFFALTLLAVSAVAQSSTSTPTYSAAPPSTSLSPCILGCVSPAATAAGCTSPADLPCVCNSTQFKTAAGQCLQEKCTAEEQQTALTLQKNECAAIASSAPASSAPASSAPASSGAPSSPASGASHSASATSPAPSSHASTTASGSAASATQSSAAIGLEVGTGIIGAAVLGLVGFVL